MLSSEDLTFFAVISASRSLVEAARVLNITPSAVSQRLKALELRVGVRLMDRSSRHLGMTDEGVMVAERGAAIAEAIERLAEDLRNRTNVVGGHLRVAAPHGFGRLYIAPAIASFARLHPSLATTLDLSDDPSSRLLESYDVVVHIGRHGPMEAVVTTLAENRRILCASPGYLKHAEVIESPNDLANHRCIVLRENEEDVTLWRFRRDPDTVATVRVASAMSCNDGTVVRDWAIAGMGVAIRSEWDVADDLETGRLLEVLPMWQLPAANVVAMLGFRHGRSARATALLASLRQNFTPHPWRGLARGSPLTPDALGNEA